VTVPRVGVVVLTQGTRPAELDRALASVIAQRGVQTDVVVVGNGWEPTGLPPGVQSLALPANVGIPAGRNRGAEALAGREHDGILFLDDDASLSSPVFLLDTMGLIEGDARVGLVQPRVVDPSGTSPPRRWVPRIRKGDPRDSGPVFSVWEGAVVLPRTVFDAIGGWGMPTRASSSPGGSGMPDASRGTRASSSLTTPPRRPRGTPSITG
jgi:GT2 family glycosyltransferase